MIAKKVMLLGEIGVGKSSLAKRLVFDKFEFDYKPTIGVDVYRYEVPDSPSRGRMTLIVWDTDGNFGDAIFRHIYMKEAAGAMIVGDVSRPTTLDTMDKLAKGFADAFPGRPATLVLNKTDLIAANIAPPLPPFLSKPGSCYVGTSAKTGKNVTQAFCDAADAIARRGL